MWHWGYDSGISVDSSLPTHYIMFTLLGLHNPEDEG
jgi:hypothetical protein